MAVINKGFYESILFQREQKQNRFFALYFLAAVIIYGTYSGQRNLSRQGRCMGNRKDSMERTMRKPGKISFIMISFVHETLYGLLRNPHKILRSAGLLPGQRVLEVGCGPGFFTVPAAEVVGPGGNILAFDVNPFAVEHVQNKIDGSGVKNAKVIIADATGTNLPDHSFDLAFVFGLAYPLGKMDEIWRELNRVIKPGGTLSVEGGLRPPKEWFGFEESNGRISRYISRNRDV